MIEPYFSRNGRCVEYERTICNLKDKTGNVIFAKDCEFPKSWSYNARVITATKYFTDEETSLHQLIDRVVSTITKAGVEQRILHGDHENFSDELSYILTNQLASFNSPVYFNIGVKNRPQQASACFILDVEDDLGSILDWIKAEAIIFKGGSGSGVNISKLRAKGEPINPRGKSDGPLSFMAGADCMAGVIKSGSVARRAAKMVIMDVDHPDIMDFIHCKREAETALRKFKAAGYDIDVNSDLLSFIPYQNANNSVSVTDKFMTAVWNDQMWKTSARTPKGVIIEKTFRATKIFREIAATAWECADPGIFFYDTINKWHTVKAAGPIRSSNPCGEFLHLPYTACNLASINLMKFVNYGDTNKRLYFDVNAFVHTVNVLITAMDILVDYSSYPLPQIAEATKKFRPLGLGYANLGALLMSLGCPYDSDGGRTIAALITSLMTISAMQTSRDLARQVGPFKGWKHNEDPYAEVFQSHLAAHNKLASTTRDVLLGSRLNWREILNTTSYAWNQMGLEPLEPGFRNSQLTLLAPTGTISFMMDCDTTGIEPDLALRKQKTLVGGGQLTIVNQNVKTALVSLDYSTADIDQIISYIKIHNTVEDCPELNPCHLTVFDCALKGGGEHCIAPMGHVNMVAAVQPFLSGGISKTINMPTEATVEDVEQILMAAWKLGLKDIAVYRDGSKVAQPLKSEKKQGDPISKITPAEKFSKLTQEQSQLVDRLLKQGAIIETKSPPVPLNSEKKADAMVAIPNVTVTTTVNGQPVEKILKPTVPQRVRLPATRQSITHRFQVASHEGYITVGLYKNGKPGELFITVSKEGSTISGLMDAFATSISMGLQYGVPLDSLVSKFKHMRFEPAGFTGNSAIPQASSIIDYIFHWLEDQFKTNETAGVLEQNFDTDTSSTIVEVVTGEICQNCGSLMRQAGSCKSCPECGDSTGCG